MKPLYTVIFAAALAGCSQQQPAAQADVAFGRPSTAQCAKDTDCKGDRICEAGVCQSPTAPAISPAVSATPASAPAEPAAPSGTPKFKDYPAKVYTGPIGKLDLSDETARIYKTRLQEAMEQQPSFAGEYVLAGWGCGTGCSMSLLVNRRTGKVLDIVFQRELMFSLLDEEDVELAVGTLVEGMEPNSRLLVVKEVSEVDDNNTAQASAKFYVLEGDSLKLLKTVKLPPIVGKPVDYGEA